MQLGFGGPNRDAHLLCDFFVPVAFDIMQDERHPCLGRELADSVLQVDGHARLARAFGVVGGLQVIRSCNSCRASLLRAEIGEHDIDRQSMQPGGKCALPAKRADHFPRAHENVLRQLLRAGGVSARSQAEGVDPTHMLAVELLEGSPVAALGLSDRLSQMCAALTLYAQIGLRLRQMWWIANG